MRIFTAAVTSDLHMTADPNASNAVIPLMQMQKEFYDAFFTSICRHKPDVLILCGDNTNSGRTADMEMLKSCLETISKAGIIIVMIPGNHDFDHCSREQYERMYFPLLKVDEKDPASLSYACTHKGVTMLAMDDMNNGKQPGFSQKTVTWLMDQLRKAEKAGNHVLFLSHRNLHADRWQNSPSFYRLQPDTLLTILKSHGVKLAFSGHLHHPCIYGDPSFYEIITPMPLSGSHMYGLLKITDSEAFYALCQTDLPRSLKRLMEEPEKKAGEKRKAAFAHLMKDSFDKQNIIDLCELFMEAVNSGTIREKKAQVLTHPAYPAFLASNSAFAVWMRCLCEEDRPPQNKVHVTFNPR